MNEFLDIASNTLPENCFKICEAQGEIAKHLEISAERALRGSFKLKITLRQKLKFGAFRKVSTIHYFSLFINS